MLENQSVLKIQGFFTSYRLKKQVALQQAIISNPNAQLLQVIDLRFQCMRAVAAAKFPINKPLEDPEQIARVIHSVKELAKEKGITNLDAVAQLFQHAIVLSTAIQSPYYDLIWRKSHYGERVVQKLIDNAYTQLRNLVRSFDLPINDPQEKSCVTPVDVLGLARDIIQHASKTMIEILASPEKQALDAISQEKFAEAIEKMLSNYMTPSTLAHSKETIHSLTQRTAECSMR